MSNRTTLIPLSDLYDLCEFTAASYKTKDKGFLQFKKNLYRSEYRSKIIDDTYIDYESALGFVVTRNSQFINNKDSVVSRLKKEIDVINSEEVFNNDDELIEYIDSKFNELNEELESSLNELVTRVNENSSKVITEILSLSKELNAFNETHAREIASIKTLIKEISELPAKTKVSSATHWIRKIFN